MKKASFSITIKINKGESQQASGLECVCVCVQCVSEREGVSEREKSVCINAVVGTL